MNKIGNFESSSPLENKMSGGFLSFQDSKSPLSDTIRNSSRIGDPSVPKLYSSLKFGVMM